jgi:endoglucanase
MRKILPHIIALVVAVAFPHFGIAGEAFGKNEFEIKRGVNLSHWLSQRDERPREQMATYLTEYDFIMLKAQGFDHIRLPIDEKEFWDEEGKPLEDAWDYLDKAITWAGRNDLRIIVDLHIIRSHYFNAVNQGEERANTLWEDPEEQKKFIALWDEISDRIGDHCVNRVAYEFMNEAVADDPDDWNNLIKKVYEFMREKEPKRTFVIGSNQWQTLDTLEHLWVPENDKNLVISFHNYEPMPLTHYKASWSPLKDYDGPIQYPGKPLVDDSFIDELGDKYSQLVKEHLKDVNVYFDYERILERLQIAVDFSEKHDLPVYCGEWGCIVYAPRELRLAYYRDWIKAFEKLGIAQAVWDYKGHFKIADDESKAIDHELIDILLSK